MLGLVISAAVGASGIASPTYLTCSLPQKDKPPFVINVTADEANQTATIEIVSTGHTERRPAVFSSVDMRFAVPIGMAAISYVINRVDLSFERIISASTVIADEKGTCVVQKPPERAF